MTKLSNVKEKAMNILEKNRYAIKYGACCAGCAIVGYTLGKYVTAVRVESGLRALMISNPKILDEMENGSKALTEVMNKVNKL